MPCSGGLSGYRPRSSSVRQFRLGAIRQQVSPESLIPESLSGGVRMSGRGFRYGGDTVERPSSRSGTIRYQENLLME